MIVNKMGSFSEARLIYKITYESPRATPTPRNEDLRMPWGPESANFKKQAEQYWRSLFTPEARELWQTGQILYDDENQALLIHVQKPIAIKNLFRRKLALRITRPKEQKDEKNATYDEYSVLSNSDFAVKQSDRIMLENKTVLAKRGRFLENSAGNLQELEATLPVPKGTREKNKLTYLTLPQITKIRSMEAKTYTVLSSKPRLSDLFNTAMLEVECCESNPSHTGKIKAYQGDNGEYYLWDTRQVEKNRVKIVKGDKVCVIDTPDMKIG